MDLNIVWGIIGTVGVGLAVLIPAGVMLYSSLVKAAKAYEDAVADGIVTDPEKIAFADEVIASIKEAGDFYNAIQNIIATIWSIVHGARIAARAKGK